jgi:hypothetical protein
MFQRLVSHNSDLKRLVDKGYAVGFDQGVIIVRDIPYLDAQQNLKIGAIVAKFVQPNPDEVKQDDHQVYFAGSVPHNTDGSAIPNLAGGATSMPLSDLNSDVVVERSFSNKPLPSGAFDDFFHKIESYVAIISGPAMALHDTTPLTYRTVEAMPESVFNFHDTLTSRAQIGDLAAKFANSWSRPPFERSEPSTTITSTYTTPSVHRAAWRRASLDRPRQMSTLRAIRAFGRVSP